MRGVLEEGPDVGPLLEDKVKREVSGFPPLDGTPTTEALQALEILVNKCSPKAMPLKVAVQAALAGPLAPYRERCRRAAEEERRADVYSKVNSCLPPDTPPEDCPRVDEAIEAILAERPNATAEEIAAEVLAPLQRASRERRARRQHMEDAPRDVEDRWEVEVILLPLEQQKALKRNAVRAFEVKDQVRIDYLKVLASGDGHRAFDLELVRLVQDRLARLLAEILPE